MECHKPNHYSTMCRSREGQNIDHGGGGQSYVEDESLFIGSVESEGIQEEAYVTIKLNSPSVELKIDKSK